MKRKDIVLIAVVVLLSAVLAYVISKLVFNTPKSRQTTVEVVDKITAEFPNPDSKYFNTNSIDPTKLITIGDNSNQSPFNQSQ